MADNGGAGWLELPLLLLSRGVMRGGVDAVAERGGEEKGDRAGVPAGERSRIEWASLCLWKEEQAARTASWVVCVWWRGFVGDEEGKRW